MISAFIYRGKVIHSSNFNCGNVLHFISLRSLDGFCAYYEHI